MAQSVPDLTKALLAEWKQIPASVLPTSTIKPSQKSGGCYSRKRWTNSILMPIILDVRCPHTFDHIVYL
uniref:Uncharacterized protein n=1 Tax=Anguilla anguilla TaxID=7936 RepID=A0A0E9VG89_ANGAN